MEAVNGSFLDEEWESLNRLLSNEDFDNFSQNFHYNNLFSYQGEIPLSFVPNGENVAAVDESLFLPFNSNFYCVSQENSNTSEFHEANAGNFFHDVNNNISEFMDFYNMECQVFPNNNVMQEIIQLRSELCNEVQLCNGDIPRLETEDSCQEMQLKRKYETTDIQNQDKEHVRISSEEKTEDNISKNPKKKPRVPRNAPKNKRNTQPKNNKKAIETKNDKEGKNAIGNGQSSSICNSYEDCNASQEPNIGSTSESLDLVSLNSTGIARASRGSATDPQSIYARKRRERINERLRILQNLVPNGTKVDISTMLEEAVHYVKFLQLQIKLLSSDDLWMYAPIAYNGIDMGLYQKIMPHQN